MTTGQVSCAVMMPIKLQLRRAEYLILTGPLVRKMNGLSLGYQQKTLQPRSQESVYTCRQKLCRVLWSPNTLR